MLILSCWISGMPPGISLHSIRVVSFRIRVRPQNRRHVHYHIDITENKGLRDGADQRQKPTVKSGRYSSFPGIKTKLTLFVKRVFKKLAMAKYGGLPLEAWHPENRTRPT